VDTNVGDKMKHDNNMFLRNYGIYVRVKSASEAKTKEYYLHLCENLKSLSLSLSLSIYIYIYIYIYMSRVAQSV
jgi:hypothetical protein